MGWNRYFVTFSTYAVYEQPNIVYLENDEPWGVNTRYANEIQRKLTAHSWIFQGCGLFTNIRKRVEKSKIQG